MQPLRLGDESDVYAPEGESGQEAGGVSSHLGLRVIDFRARNNQAHLFFF